MSAALAIAITLVVAVAAWAFTFLPDRRGFWTRTWISGVVLAATAVGCLAAAGELGDALGPLDVVEIGLGLAVGGAWLAATHIGFQVIAWVLPAFGDQVRDLYRLREGDASGAALAAPLVLMGVAEELVFRGVLQALGGFVLGLAAYTAVQAFERKWALALAALLSGAVWGALAAWRGGLLAPIVAHVTWTATLTFVWPLGGRGGPAPTRPGTARAARA